MEMKKEPLTESYFYILLCLYKGPTHGYGIMQESARMSGGRVKIGSGTMYGATSNMLKKGWIEEAGSETEASNRRRLYRLTDEGREVLIEEILRLRNMVDQANAIVKV